MGGFRTEPYAPKLQDLDAIQSLLEALNEKTVKVDTDNTYTHSPLELAMEGERVGVFNHLESLASGASTNIYLSNPPDNGTVKFALFIDTTDQGQVNIYVDPTVDTSSATQLEPIPVLAGQVVDLGASAYAGVTLSTTTPDVGRVIPGGSGRFAQGNTSAGLPGFGLMPGHSVAIEVVNLSSNTNTVSYFMVVWEEG